MNLTPTFLDELRSRISIVQVVGKKVSWDQKKSNQGRGDMWAPCPFHQEKTASFHVDEQKGYYYCFGCQAKGDAIGFIKDTENLSFVDAVEALVQEAGMQMPKLDVGSQDKLDYRKKLINVMEISTQFYRHQLTDVIGLEARKYLKSRGLGKEICNKYEIGFAPSKGDLLFKYLLEKGISEDLILGAGLCVESDNSGQVYDRFRDRIIFPIRNNQSKCIAFGGRAMNKNAKAKYLNSPETKLFDKGNTLYNQNLARKTLSKGKPLIVVEGYMDVIAMDSFGFGQCVAPLGTAITERQLYLLWNMSPEPIIALDGDAAGYRAAQRLIDIALPLLNIGQSLRFCLLPEGQDPDDVLRTLGSTTMVDLLTNSVPLIDLLWERETADKVFDSPERKMSLDQSIRNILNKINNVELRKHYASGFTSLRSRLFNLERGRREPGTREKPLWINARGTSSSRVKKSLIALSVNVEERLREALVLALMLRHPGFILEFMSELEALEFRIKEHQAIALLLLEHAGESNSKELSTKITKALAGQILEKTLNLQYLSLVPAMNANAPEPQIRQTISEELAKIDARRGVEREIRDAIEDLDGKLDEGITWRVSKAAEANNAANKSQAEHESGDSQNHAALSQHLQSFIDNEIWKKKKPD